MTLSGRKSAGPPHGVSADEPDIEPPGPLVNRDDEHSSNPTTKTPPREPHDPERDEPARSCAPASPQAPRDVPEEPSIPPAPGPTGEVHDRRRSKKPAPREGIWAPPKTVQVPSPRRRTSHLTGPANLENDEGPPRAGRPFHCRPRSGWTARRRFTRRGPHPRRGSRSRQPTAA